MYKIIFPTTINSIKNVYNDYLDINIIFDDGTIYFATFVTFEFVKDNILNENMFWIEDMVIVKDLNVTTLKTTIKKLVNEYNIDEVFCRIDYLDQNKNFNNIKCELFTNE